MHLLVSKKNYTYDQCTDNASNISVCYKTHMLMLLMETAFILTIKKTLKGKLTNAESLTGRRSRCVLNGLIWTLLSSLRRHGPTKIAITAIGIQNIHLQIWKYIYIYTYTHTHTFFLNKTISHIQHNFQHQHPHRGTFRTAIPCRKQVASHRVAVCPGHTTLKPRTPLAPDRNTW